MRRRARLHATLLGIGAIVALGAGTIAPAYADDVTTPAAATSIGDQDVDTASPGDPSVEASSPAEWIEKQSGSDVEGPAAVQVPADDDDLTPCGGDASTICSTATVDDDASGAPTPASSASATARSLAARSTGTAAAADDDPTDPLISTGCLSSPRSAKWSVARWVACSHRAGILTLITKEGERVGRVRFDTFQEVTGSPTEGEWDNAFLIKIKSATGIGAETEVIGQGSCIGKCTFEGGSDIRGAMIPRTALQGSSHFTWHGAVGTQVRPVPLWELNYSHPNGITIDGAVYKSPKIRCDRKYPGLKNSVGCVFPQQQADMWFNYAGTWGDHVNSAQISGLPVTLHRATAAERAANRAAACATAPRPRPTGYQCDEYPYASAAEGASAGTGTVRVLDRPDWDGTQLCGMPPTANQTGEGGWSICLIPTDDNQHGGTLLNDLYKAYRVIPGDAFSTRINYDT